MKFHFDKKSFFLFFFFLQFFSNSLILELYFPTTDGYSLRVREELFEICHNALVYAINYISISCEIGHWKCWRKYCKRLTTTWKRRIAEKHENLLLLLELNAGHIYLFCQFTFFEWPLLTLIYSNLNIWAWALLLLRCWKLFNASCVCCGGLPCLESHNTWTHMSYKDQWTDCLLGQ